jgi:peroxiredoxin Q/BCP
MLEPGDDAPAFALDNHAGESVALPTEGTVVVYFYPRADTPGCTTEACSFRDAWSEYESRGIDVFGVSDNPVEDLAAFRAEHSLTVELLSDPDGAVASAYDSYGEKNVFGDTVKRTFRNTYVVRDGTVVLAYEGVDPEDHADELLADIDSL